MFWNNWCLHFQNLLFFCLILAFCFLVEVVGDADGAIFTTTSSGIGVYNIPTQANPEDEGSRVLQNSGSSARLHSSAFQKSVIIKNAKFQHLICIKCCCCTETVELTCKVGTDINEACKRSCRYSSTHCSCYS